MKIKKILKRYPTIYHLALEILFRLNWYNYRFWKKYKNYRPDERWSTRIATALASPDNEKIEKTPSAGKLTSDYQILHNNLKIHLGSYYTYGNTRLLEENAGVHEPQEEYVFQEVLKRIPEEAAMLELGSYWSFYSLWFNQKIKKAKNYMVEPDPYKMFWGMKNFELNDFKGVFINGFVSDATDFQSNPKVLTVDYIVDQNNIAFLDILHSDIQGFELEMLKGAEFNLNNKKIGYLFISTHSNELHQSCIQYLKLFEYTIIADADLNESFSWDGLIVAKSPTYNGIDHISISKRKS